jgi:hypothetical protein
MTWQPLLLALVAIVVALVRECQPYSFGAPYQVCKRMAPGDLHFISEYLF